VQKWLFDFGPLCGSPAIGPDGSIYIGTNDGYLCALHPRGRPDLIVEVGPVSTSPAIARNGTVYLGMEDGQLVALYPDGKKKWAYRTPGAIRSSCAIARNGTVYFGSEDGCLRALAPDGTKLWKYVTKGPILSSPSVSDEGTIYFGSGDGFLRALDPDGHKKWEFETKTPVISSPAIAADGTVYVTSTDGYLYALGKHDTRKDLASGLEAGSSVYTDKGLPSVAHVSGRNVGMRFETASRTDVGRSRKGKNEDALGVLSPKNARELKRNGILLVVADGVGGEPCGDEASRIAVDALLSSYSGDPTTGRSVAERLRDGFAKANAAVFSASEEPGHRGMCTTLVAAAVFPDRVVFANVGDSRGYIIPSLIGPASQVTVDHSEVQEMVQQGLLTQEQAEVASNRNVITRVVGTSHALKVDVFDVRLRRGDTVMLCSDGLVTAVGDAEIAGVIQNSPLDVAVDRLIELAKGPKGHDNVTVCAARLTKVDTSE
jgi:serine/threonine protein phosphatase PrpC